MRLRYRIPLAIISIMIVISMFIGSSFALWRVTKYQETENIIDTGCFKLTFIEQTSSINLTNAYPITNTKGLQTTPYTFTVKNDCTVDANFAIYLNTLNVTGTKIDDNLIDYSLKKSTDASAVANKLSTSIRNTDTSHFNYSGKTIQTSYSLATGTLRGRSAEGVDDGESATYSLRLWIDESATKEISGQKFEAAIASVGYATDLD